MLYVCIPSGLLEGLSPCSYYGNISWPDHTSDHFPDVQAWHCTDNVVIVRNVSVISQPSFSSELTVFLHFFNRGGNRRQRFLLVLCKLSMPECELFKEAIRNLVELKGLEVTFALSNSMEWLSSSLKFMWCNAEVLLLTNWWVVDCCVPIPNWNGSGNSRS